MGRRLLSGHVRAVAGSEDAGQCGRSCGFRAPYRTWLEILGTEGALRVPNPFKPGMTETVELERASGIERIEIAGSTLLFQREVDDFVSAVLDGTPPVIPLAESRRTVATLTALYRAATEGRTVTCSD